jgi:hypothetical protein
MSNGDNRLAPLRRFRIFTVRITLITIVVLAALALLISRNATQGVLLGGIAGILGFWIMAVRLEKLVVTNPQKVQFAALTMSTVRFLMYGAVLYKSFLLDEETYHGLLGALVGLMTIRFVLVFVGITAKDQAGIKTEVQNEPDAEIAPDNIQEEPDDSSKPNG